MESMGDLLREEDTENRGSQTIGECMEFMLMNNVLEHLCTYAAIDTPRGFFLLVLEFLGHLLINIRATTLLAHRQVHPFVKSFMNGILTNLQNEA